VRDTLIHYHRTTAAFDHADLTTQDSFGFYKMPYPSDLRLTRTARRRSRISNNLMAPIIEGLNHAMGGRASTDTDRVLSVRWRAPDADRRPSSRRIVSPVLLLVDGIAGRGKLFRSSSGAAGRRYLDNLSVAARIGSCSITSASTRSSCASR
jgi:hypothetical protein